MTAAYLWGMLFAGVIWMIAVLIAGVCWQDAWGRNKHPAARRLILAVRSVALVPVWPVAVAGLVAFGAWKGAKAVGEVVSEVRKDARHE